MLTGSTVDVFLHETRQFVLCHRLSLAGIVIELPHSDSQPLEVGQQVELTVCVEDLQATAAGVIECQEMQYYAIDLVWDDSERSASELERLRDICHRLETNWILNRFCNSESDTHVIGN